LIGATSPACLRAPLRAFLSANRHGVFWLQAPAHPGKSLFVRGLAELSEAGGEQWLLNDLQVAGVFIRRDYRYSPGQILPLLEQVLKRALDVAERADRRLPQIDLAASDPAAACARFVADYRALSDVGGRLLIVFDGLDELRPPSPVAACSTSSPRRANSPACVCVLLTSRPLGDGSCPHWIGQRLQRLRAAEGLRVHRGAPDDPGYLQLLQDYFERETEATRARLEAVAVQAGTAPEKARADTRQRFTDLFPVLLDKAHGLFLYFAFLLDRIQERELPLDALALQLGGEVLPTDFIETLADALAAKQAELARTLLLTLAAVEQAHAWYVLEREPPYAVEPDWRGLPLDSLAELIHYPGMDGELLHVPFRTQIRARRLARRLGVQRPLPARTQGPGHQHRRASRLGPRADLDPSATGGGNAGATLRSHGR